MSCSYVNVDFFTEENAKKAFEFCKENFDWFEEPSGSSAGFVVSGTKISSVEDHYGNGLDWYDFPDVSSSAWLKELSENGFDFKAKIVEDGSDVSNDSNSILECESKNKEFTSTRRQFMWDNGGWGCDILWDDEIRFFARSDVWDDEPIKEKTLEFKYKKTGKVYKYTGKFYIRNDSFDEMVEEGLGVDCGVFRLINNELDLMSPEFAGFEDADFLKDFVPVDGGEALVFNDDEIDNILENFTEEFELVNVSNLEKSPDSATETGSSVSVPKLVSDTFTGDTSLKSIEIPAGIIKIGKEAFKGCSSLASIVISDSVKKIGESAFEDCTSLASVVIPAKVKEIGKEAFGGCTSLTSVTISAGVTAIGDYAFRECTSLTSVTIPESVTKIGSFAFPSCTSLTSVTIPDSVTAIGEFAFYFCCIQELEHPCLKIQNGLAIKDGTLEYCADGNMTECKIPESVTAIGWSAFRECTSLTSVTIPESVTAIGDYAFDGCTSLTSVTFGGTKQQWESLDRHMPNSVKTIKCSDGVIEK